MSLLAVTPAAFAQDAAAVVPKIDTGDNAWMLASSALVLMMTGPGLALFYGGLVRSKNVLATMMQSMFLMSFVSILWFLYGYSVSFGEGNAFFGSFTQYAFLRGVRRGEGSGRWPRRFSDGGSVRLQADR